MVQPIHVTHNWCPHATLDGIKPHSRNTVLLLLVAFVLSLHLTSRRNSLLIPVSPALFAPQTSLPWVSAYLLYQRYRILFSVAGNLSKWFIYARRKEPCGPSGISMHHFYWKYLHRTFWWILLYTPHICISRLVLYLFRQTLHQGGVRFPNAIHFVLIAYTMARLSDVNQRKPFNCFGGPPHYLVIE